MKVLLCCILKMENRYLTEWIEHYKKLGVDKFVIYDNNDIIGEYAENIEDVKIIKKGIAHNLIDVYKIPSPQKAGIQNIVYDECYAKYNKDYDWLMFFDIDEFLILEKFNVIQDYLSQDKFKSYDLIHLNWKLFDDNDIIKSPESEYSVLKTYTRELSDIYPERFELCNEMKSIIRGGLNNITHRNAHTVNNNIKSCNAMGIEDNSYSFVSKYPCHKGAWLNHYITKSISEYINVKLARQKTDTSNICSIDRVNLPFFGLYNRIDDKKIKYISNLFHLNEVQYKNDIQKYLNNHLALIKSEQEKYCNKLNLNNINNNSNIVSPTGKLIFNNPIPDPVLPNIDNNKKMIFR